MQTFKEAIFILCRPFGIFGFGLAISNLFAEDYKTAAWILFVVSIILNLVLPKNMEVEKLD
jgi:hypothetical protein